MTIEDELARIDRGLSDLLVALRPLTGVEPPAEDFAAEAPTPVVAPPAPVHFSPPSPPRPTDAMGPAYSSATAAGYLGAPAAARNAVAVYGSAPTEAPAPAAPVPSPAGVAQAVAAPNGSPVLAAIALMHPGELAPPVAVAEMVDVPFLEAVRPRSRSEAGWVGNAIRRLSHYRPELAGRAIIAMLPMQGDVITDEVTYDLVVTDEVCHAVTVEKDETSIQRVAMPRPLATIDARIEARIESLGAVPFRAPLRTLRRSDAFRIHGRARKKALSALKALAIAPVSLAETRAAGVKLSDELILGIVGAGINPEWTIGHRFTIAIKIEDAAPGEASELFVRVNDGAAVTLSRGLPLDMPSATLSCTSEELANVLLGQSVGRNATLAGERAPVMLLQGWVARLESGRG